MDTKQLKRFIQLYMLPFVCEKFNKHHSSYGWKHIAEKYFRYENYPETYVSNEEFIQACKELNIPFRMDKDGINAYFKTTKKSTDIVWNIFDNVK